MGHQSDPTRGSEGICPTGLELCTLTGSQKPILFLTEDSEYLPPQTGQGAQGHCWEVISSVHVASLFSPVMGI